ncbi:MAG: hypothetical protein C0501_11430 [Isosphaera sp.]|nr:hypothetical protein [Isosphaera sp.]
MRLPILLGCLAAAGCGRGLDLAPVAGRVAVGGKAVTSGVVMFHPPDGPTAVGEIRPDGTFTLTTVSPGDGAVVGPHRVTIQATTVGPGMMVEPKSLDEEMKLSREKLPGGKILVPGKVTWVVPERLSRADTTTLTAEVRPGPNAIDFDLPGP